MCTFYKSNKKMYFFFCFAVFALIVPALHVAADEYYANESSGLGMMTLNSITLPFDPNSYHFLIYNPGGTQSRIEGAMSILGISYDERGPGNDVTASDLTEHDILIVGWNDDGSTSGLDDSILAAGITGRILLTGHDLDFHTADPYGYQEAAETMLY